MAMWLSTYLDILLVKGIYSICSVGSFSTVVFERFTVGLNGTCAERDPSLLVALAAVHFHQSSSRPSRSCSLVEIYVSPE